MNARVTVVGGGLAGSEAALQLAARGIAVDLREMRPVLKTPAHRTGSLAEVVCSNSFKSTARAHASGLLKRELGKLGCFLLSIAYDCRVEAGTALAIDRELFSAAVTARVENEPLIRVHRGEVRALPPRGPVVVATGPLTSPALARSLSDLLRMRHLHFYDSTAPVVAAESIDRSLVFEANRRGAGEGHYLNCPLTFEEYEAFVDAVLAAELYPLHDFEDTRFFEACLPIDELARRGRKTLAYGPMRPVGLVDPRTGSEPYAVVQLRPENREATAYNLVGFQNRIRHGDQRRVLRMIPGLARAEFYRLGRIHRNAYLEAPKILDRRLRARRAPRVTVAGQLTGLEGYVEAITTGLLAGLFVAEAAAGRALDPFPRESALGTLLEFVSGYEGSDYRPTNVSFGLFPALPDRRLSPRERNEAMVSRAESAFDDWLRRHPDAVAAVPAA